ncbi:MAG: DUF362 domain-containing protein [Phycisphaeraceae bacterium]
MSTTRRAFLTQIAAWSAGALAVPTFRISPAMAAEGAGAQVAVAEGKDYAALVQRVLEPLGGIGQFVKRGDRVVVKPNIGWDRTPEQAANTHPEVVEAIVRLALDAGAREVKVFDRPCNNERRSYNNSGILPAVERIGSSRARCEYVNPRRFIPVNIEKGKAVHEWELYGDAIRWADCYINVPIAKHHGLTKLTLGLKNVMGVCGGRRGQIHQNIAQKLADLNTVVYAGAERQLTLIDATRILLRNGPTGGNLEDVAERDTLVASPDIVAADAWTTTLFDHDPKEIEPTVAAYEMGLGEMDLDRIEVLKG